jgi:hypothetical protein
MCISSIMSILQSTINTNIEINSMIYNNDINIVDIEQISRFHGGVCMFKNNKGQCKSKHTFLVRSIGKCVCYLHMTHQQNTVHKLIKFHIFFKKYIKKLFKCTNDNNKYIETLKDILLLMINHKKYKYTLQDHFNIVNKYIDNFEIDDEEYNALLDHYKFA